MSCINSPHAYNHQLNVWCAHLPQLLRLNDVDCFEFKRTERRLACIAWKCQNEKRRDRVRARHAPAHCLFVRNTHRRTVKVRDNRQHRNAFYTQWVRSLGRPNGIVPRKIEKDVLCVLAFAHQTSDEHLYSVN